MKRKSDHSTYSSSDQKAISSNVHLQQVLLSYKIQPYMSLK